ncbi:MULTISPECIES: MobF family relaxase [unclassified Streptomyces]|uniref:MobF family relaxase n=1 Tax=unclassified Streptomyces TaxID=2593676 RepID=UPI0029B0D72D|nr:MULTISPECIES: MobF family relaxase [unclassified Streptomyces]MDX3772360.1 MobF family relaxase [Streptomyces sp. AK08-01B]MDX3821856.1 MobF family relaxase [Streptomyces sp. AK08-01A]
MVTCKQVSKGSAYKYYGREVVVGDGRRPRGKSLEEAQEEAGVPPGVWMGRALPAVGLVAGARVTERQMRNLFGEGLHPDADHIVAGRLAAGDSPAAAARAARLGYRVQKWSGNDLVFRPPGSVQALWALGTPSVRQLVEDIHTRIIGEVLTEAETEHLWVRVGGDSTVQRARAGVIAARFRHYENRDGMPLLHDHVVLSVKVRRQDDRWGTLHTRSFLEYAVALSELYNQRLMEEICRALGLATVPRYPTAGQRPVMELAGIPEQLIDWAATRNKATMQRLAELADQYQKRTRQPLTTKIRQRMMARASHETRPAKKKTSRPLSVLLERWRDGAVALVGEEVIDNLLRLARLAAAAIRTTVRTIVDVAAAALEITALVSVHHGGRFRHRHLLAEARRYLTRTLHGYPAQPHTDTAITAAAIRDHCIPGDLPNPDGPMPLAHRIFTPAWAPNSPRSSTTPAAHRIHHRARAEAARRTALARTEAQQGPPVRQQEHTPQAAPQQPPPPAPSQAPARPSPS